MGAEAGLFLMGGFFLSGGRTLPSSSEPIGVDTFLGTVRNEIERLETNEDAKHQAKIFRIKNLDLELNFVVKGNAKGQGEFKTEIVTVGTELDTARERSQKIVLHMEVAPPRTVSIEPSAQPLSEEGGKELPFVPRKGHK